MTVQKTQAVWGKLRPVLRSPVMFKYEIKARTPAAYVNMSPYPLLPPLLPFPRRYQRERAGGSVTLMKAEVIHICFWTVLLRGIMSQLLKGASLLVQSPETWEWDEHVVYQVRMSALEYWRPWVYTSVAGCRVGFSCFLRFFCVQVLFCSTHGGYPRRCGGDQNLEKEQEL